MVNKPCGGGDEVATVSQLHYLAKIYHLAVSAELSSCPALQFWIDVSVILVCC